MLWNGSMLYQFDPFELDLATFELRADGKACNLEPQVLWSASPGSNPGATIGICITCS